MGCQKRVWGLKNGSGVSKTRLGASKGVWGWVHMCGGVPKGVLSVEKGPGCRKQGVECRKRGMGSRVSKTGLVSRKHVAGGSK